MSKRLTYVGRFCWGWFIGLQLMFAISQTSGWWRLVFVGLWIGLTVAHLLWCREEDKIEASDRAILDRLMKEFHE